MNIEERITLALNILNDEQVHEYPFFFRIYPFSTENLSGWMPLFDFNGKSFLTIGSSADQVLNASYLGYKKQTVIDINPFTQEYFHLKRSGIIILNRKEYLDFFVLIVMEEI